MVTAGSGGTDDTSRSAVNIAQGHGYTVLSTAIIDGTKLVRIRNPWGKEDYTGPWNDKDTANWDKNVQAKAQYHKDDKKDGIFYIPIDTYK